jgi:hypothetical protein
MLLQINKRHVITTIIAITLLSGILKQHWFLVQLVTTTTIQNTPSTSPAAVNNQQFNNNTIIHWNVTTGGQTLPTLFYCQHVPSTTIFPWDAVFPEYVLEDLSSFGSSKAIITWKSKLQYKGSNEYDIFMFNFNMGGLTSCSSIIMHWLLTTFKGHIIAFSGESPRGHPFKSKKPHMHYFGPVTNPSEFDILTFYMQSVWYSNQNFRTLLSPNSMVEKSKRPKGSQSLFMVYMQSNCIPMREEAALRLSEIGPVYCLGKCKGMSRPDSNQTNLLPHLNMSASNVSLSSTWSDNIHLYSMFQFCLVMKHVYQPGYIT